MARLACVDVAGLSLQLLFLKHHEWRELPAAVVSRDSPYGTILAANALAREFGIEPGLRYASALSLNHELRADTIPEQTVREGSDLISSLLRRFSPLVEESDSEPGVYWLDAAGMSSLFPELKTWCRTIRSSLSEQGFTATMAVGFSRFGCYAAAKSTPEQAIFPDIESERSCALAAGIQVLNLPPDALERLRMLGVLTVGSFLRLPAGGVGKRFGPEVKRLYRFASSELDLPLQPTEWQAEPELSENLPYAEFSSERLIGYLKRLLERLAADLQKRHRLIRELRIGFILEDEEALLEPILPSSPTMDSELLAELAALRLESLKLPGPAVAIRMSASTVTERNIQADLFASSSRASLKEVEKVFSRLRAVFGNHCVQRARLDDEHDPQLKVGWENMEKLPQEVLQPAEGLEAAAGREPEDGSQPAEGREPGEGLQATERRAVRRLFSTPLAASPADFRKLWGPYPLSGSWWRGEQPRDYYYAETREGEILWLYIDRADGRWRQIGVVE